MERLSTRLQVDAMLHKREAERANEPREANGWWRVDRALNEAVLALRELRNAPGQNPEPGRPIHPHLDPAKLDHQGVPEKA